MCTRFRSRPGITCTATLPTTRRCIVTSVPISVLLLPITSAFYQHKAEALPLGPLGKGSTFATVGGAKRVGESPEEIANILARNLKDGQYFITGDLTPEIFTDDCRFRDPTNDIRGLARYLKALSILFDANYSAVRLKSIEVTSPQTIQADWYLGGYLKFPWAPRVAPFEGHTVYHLNNEGLIDFQDQSWSISGVEALRESFTPSKNGPTDDIVQEMKGIL